MRLDDQLLGFPCSFPIKAMGYWAEDFVSHVASLVRPHVAAFAEDAVQDRASRNGTYLAVTVTIEATSRDQLDAIYRALSADDRVLVAL